MTQKYYEYFNNAYSFLVPNFDASTIRHENAKTIIEFISIYDKIHKILHQNHKALELGCGHGGVSDYLSRAGLDCMAIDQSSLVISHNKIDLSGVEFLASDVLLAEIKDKFNLIVDSHLLHCLVEDKDRAKYFENIKEWITVDGKFLVETMCFNENLEIPFDYEFREDFSLYHDGKAFRKIATTRMLEEEFLSHGFKIDYLYYHDELSFELYPQDPDISHQQLPKTLRVVLSLPNK